LCFFGKIVIHKSALFRKFHYLQVCAFPEILPFTRLRFFRMSDTIESEEMNYAVQEEDLPQIFDMETRDKW
jgi:hypothetical protein